MKDGPHHHDNIQSNHSSNDPPDHALSRRDALRLSGAAVAGSAAAMVATSRAQGADGGGPNGLRYAQTNCMTEWWYASSQEYADPFNEVELDVIFTNKEDRQRRVPAFWAGDQTWRIRYATPEAGTHRYRTVCSDPDNADLHGKEGTLEVRAYEGSNELLKHGPLRAASNGRYLEFIDGTPLFWLSDTWWLGLSARLKWPGDVQTIAADRVAKGFTAVTIGLQSPDVTAFDEQAANEAGFTWTPDFARINPAFFDLADLRIHWLVSSGLVPCFVASWQEYMHQMGVEKLKKHWRNLVARYGAYPVVWCLYGDDNKSERAEWGQVAAYLRKVDPYGHPLTKVPHDNSSARRESSGAFKVDLDSISVGMNGPISMQRIGPYISAAHALEPPMPVILSECCYEGMFEQNREDLQRFAFWSAVLSGACGFTYGANGVWQVNIEDKPFLSSLYVYSHGIIPWRDGMSQPGSTQVGLGKKLLDRYPWWRLEPHPEWVEPHWTKQNYEFPYAAAIPGEMCIIYFRHWFGVGESPVAVISGFKAGANYHGFYFDPSTGKETDLGLAKADGQGRWPAPKPPIWRDWVLVVEPA